MNDVLVDAGPLVALLDRSDERHRSVRNALAACRGHVYTTWAALTEASHLVSRPDMRFDLVEMIRTSAVRLVDLDASHFDDIAWFHAKYRDRDPDLADLSLVVASDMLGIYVILSFDRDFLVYRTRKGRALACPLLQPGA